MVPPEPAHAGRRPVSPGPSRWELPDVSAMTGGGARGHRCRPRAGHAAGRLPGGPLPDARGEAARLVVTGPARRAGARAGARVAIAAPVRPPVRGAVSTPASAEWCGCAPTPPAGVAGSPPSTPGPTPSCTPSAGRTRSRCGRGTCSRVGCSGSRSAGCSRRSPRRTSVTDASKVAVVALADLLAADDGEPDHRRPVAHRSPGDPRGGRAAAAGLRGHGAAPRSDPAGPERSAARPGASSRIRWRRG